MRHDVDRNVADGTTSTNAAELVAAIRGEVARLHAELPRWGLVVWTAGNVSARTPDADLS